MKQVIDTGIVSLLEAFFHEEEDRGCKFQVRRMNFFKNEKRTLDILDELEERAKMQKAFEESEAKRDMTYDEFITRYLDHIDGRVDAGQRDVNRPITAEGAGTDELNVNKSALVTIASQNN